MMNENQNLNFENGLKNGAIVQTGRNNYLILGGFLDGWGRSLKPARVKLFDYFRGQKYDAKTVFIEISGDELIQNIDRFVSSLALIQGENTKKPRYWSYFDKPGFLSDFDQIMSAIDSGVLQKAVPVTEQSSDWVPNDLEKVLLLKNLIQKKTDSLFVYGVFGNTWGVLGATPEILFTRQGTNIETMALAGTLPKSQGTPDILLNDPKELLENRLVSEFIVEKLSKISKVNLAPMEVKELPTIWHLYRRITAELNFPVEDDQLILKMHPTPALGVSSETTNYFWMEKLKYQNQREYFGAPLLISTLDWSIALVCIRNLSWNGNKSVIRAGCGIVRGSQKEKEWNELVAKIGSVKELLGIE